MDPSCDASRPCGESGSDCCGSGTGAASGCCGTGAGSTVRQAHTEAARAVPASALLETPSGANTSADGSSHGKPPTGSDSSHGAGEAEAETLGAAVRRRRRRPIPASRLCQVCHKARAAIQRPKTGQKVCKTCFYACFEEEIHRTIVSNKLFHRGQRVAIAASGGKGTCARLMRCSLCCSQPLPCLRSRRFYGASSHHDAPEQAARLWP